MSNDPFKSIIAGIDAQIDALPAKDLRKTLKESSREIVKLRRALSQIHYVAWDGLKYPDERLMKATLEDIFGVNSDVRGR